MSQEEANISRRRKRIQAVVALLAVSAVIVGVAILSSPNAATTSSSVDIDQPKASTTTQGQPTTTSGSGTTYKNGSYSATGIYFSPGGQESLSINLTLNNDIVTTASVKSGANDPTAVSYQDLFISGYKSKVVGKKISSIKLTNVSGSSLTSQGFDNALKQIEKQAQA